MKHLVTDQLRDFSAIHENDVELVSVAGHDLEAFSILARCSMANRRELRAQWIQTNEGSDESTAALSGLVETPLLPGLSRELRGPVEALSEILSCDAVSVRVDTPRNPVCPRFHRDHVTCRLLITVAGTGTEWIAHDDVDEAALPSHVQGTPPLITGGTIRNLATGSWSLLKGGAWNGSFAGVVHRSPPERASRLLLTFDPLFACDTNEESWGSAARMP